jgi:hypothetical protein
MAKAIIPELAPLVRWLQDVAAVLAGRSVLTYRDSVTDIPHVCVPTGLFERGGELWVVGRDPACDCVTGSPLRLCSVGQRATDAFGNWIGPRPR